MAKRLYVDISEEGEAAIVAFQKSSVSNVDEITAASKEIREYIKENQPRKVVFDFERVRFFSSQVLGLLLDARARLGEYEGEVVLSGVNPQLYRVFKITNLDKVFRFFGDKESAAGGVSVE
jgi:anti-sigma B factor antagonist